MVQFNENIDMNTNNLTDNTGGLDIEADIDFVGDMDINDIDRLNGDSAYIDIDNAYGAVISTDTIVDGKLDASGFDPEYILLDCMTREGIIEKAYKDIPPSKQEGAMLFFNKEDKKLEIYVQSEGKFYNLGGEVVSTCQKKCQTKATKVYLLDRTTGEIKIKDLLTKPRNYKLKNGIHLDSRTGKFKNKKGEEISKEEAIIENG